MSVTVAGEPVLVMLTSAAGSTLVASLALLFAAFASPTFETLAVFVTPGAAGRATPTLSATVEVALTASELEVVHVTT